jgi:hypothetical protein
MPSVTILSKIRDISFQGIVFTAETLGLYTMEVPECLFENDATKECSSRLTSFRPKSLSTAFSSLKENVGLRVHLPLGFGLSAFDVVDVPIPLTLTLVLSLRERKF